MKRIAILIEKNLSVGESANVASILMGQASICDTEIFSHNTVVDKDNKHHAGIKYSTIILKAGQGQLLNLSKKVSEEFPSILSILFSKTGQTLNDQFDEYKNQITSRTTEETHPVGLILIGDIEDIKILTKKFSLYT